MSNLLLVTIAALVGACTGALVVWIGIMKSRQIRVRRLISHLNATNRDLASLTKRVSELERHIHDPKQFQKRVLQGITEAVNRLAALDLDVSDSVPSELPISPFPGD